MVSEFCRAIHNKAELVLFFRFMSLTKSLIAWFAVND